MASMIDSVLRVLRFRPEPEPVDPWENLPWDDEPLTAEDIAAIEEAEAEIPAGRFVTLEEVEREFGIVSQSAPLS